MVRRGHLLGLLNCLNTVHDRARAFTDSRNRHFSLWKDSVAKVEQLQRLLRKLYFLLNVKVFRIILINKFKIYKEKMVATRLKSSYKSRFALTCFTSSGHIISKLYALTEKDSSMVSNKNSLGWVPYLEKKIEWYCFSLSESWIRDTLRLYSAKKNIVFTVFYSVYNWCLLRKDIWNRECIKLCFFRFPTIFL